MARKCRSSTNTFMELPTLPNRGHGHFVYIVDDGRRWIVALDDTEDSGKSVYTPAQIAT